MIGRRVRQLRAAHGESLREAAQRTGVSHTTIARIENGGVTGSFQRTLRAIADGYGVPVEFLTTGRDPRVEPEAQIQARALEAGATRYVRAVQALAREGVTPEDLERYAGLIVKASRANVRAGALDMALDLLVSQHRALAVGG